MPRGKQIIKTIELEECSLFSASQDFFNHNKAKGLSIETQKSYKSYVNMFIKWIGKDMYMHDINSRIIDNYVLFNKDKGIKDISVATTMRHLLRFFRFCKERGYMVDISVTIPKYEEEIKEPYSDEEMKRLLKRPCSNNWVEYRSWVMINYFYSTGQRLSTVLNIKIKDLDLDNHRVKLTWNKDKIQKYMPLSTAIVNILKEYIGISALEYNDYLFPEYEGRQLKKRSAEDAIADYNKNRNVEKTSIHLFRHTFAKKYITAGGNPVKLQRLLNHKTIDMTMHYVNLFSMDIDNDFDLFNPLDNFKRNNHTATKRKKITT